MAKLRVTYNAPVVLTFAILALIVTLLPMETRQHYFAAHADVSDWTGYTGLFLHILGHANWEHYLGNFMLILLLGPILEERHGSMKLLMMMLITALVTGLVTLAVGKGLLGASGIVFMMILLASTANIRQGEIPLTFIAVAVIFLGGEVYRAVTKDDNVSRMAHLLGGVAGAAFGFLGARARAVGDKPMKDLGLGPSKPVPVEARPKPTLKA